MSSFATNCSLLLLNNSGIKRLEAICLFWLKPEEIGELKKSVYNISVCSIRIVIVKKKNLAFLLALSRYS
jgi:hypothetical protein